MGILILIYIFQYFIHFLLGAGIARTTRKKYRHYSYKERREEVYCGFAEDMK